MLFRSLALVLLAAVTLAQELPNDQDFDSSLEKRSFQESADHLVGTGLEKRTIDYVSYVNVAYSDLHYQLLDSYNTLAAACPAATLGQVILAFAKVQSKIIILAVRSRLAWTLNRGCSAQFVDPFFQSLREFQILLKFVNNYPKLVIYCRPIFNVITLYLNRIISEMRTDGVEFSGPTRAYAKFINYDFYRFIGISLDL